MIRSIRYFLLISLLAGITLASAINGIGNYLLDEKIIQPYLDSQLIRATTIIDLLYHTTKENSKIRRAVLDYLKEEQPLTGQRFLFQIWDLHGALLINSGEEIHFLLNNAKLGFSDKTLDGIDWRIYSTLDKTHHVKIVAAESSNQRRQLADDIVLSNTYLLLITYPVFGILVWLIINIALRSITRVTKEISHRASTYLEPLHLSKIPIEIKPLVAELNQLLIRLRLAFDRNKRFAGDAAHELRTPLAALKTHVQIALKASNLEEKNLSLMKVIESVDRSSHVVAQLLTLSRLAEEEGLKDTKVFDLLHVTTEIVAMIACHALEKSVEIELHTNESEKYLIFGNDTAIGILIRNIVDNAIRYTPSNGHVHVFVERHNLGVRLRVIDSGIGIAPDLRARVFERFYRVLGTKAQGSGLGLAIVKQIANLHHAEITLNDSPFGQGLEFCVAFPKIID